MKWIASISIAGLCLVLSAGCRSYGPRAGEKARQLIFGCDHKRDVRNLSSDNSETRRWCLIRLGRNGNPEDAPALAARLDPNTEPVPLVRATAAAGLRAMGDARALPALRTACVDPDRHVRAEAVRALAILGKKDVMPLLTQRLLEDRDYDVRLQAAYAVARIGGDAALAPLAAALADPDESVVFAAHNGLSRLTGRDLPPVHEPWRQWLKNRNQVK